MFNTAAYGRPHQAPDSQPLGNFCARPPTTKKLVPLPVWKFLQIRALNCCNHFPQEDGGGGGARHMRNYWTNTNCPGFKVIIKSGINAFSTTALLNLSLFVWIWAGLFQSVSLEDTKLYE